MRLSRSKDTLPSARARRRPAPTGRMGAILALMICGLMAPVTAAAGLPGTYRGAIPTGDVTVTLEATGENLTGSLSGPGIELALLGAAQGDAAYGLAFRGDESIAFEAHLAGDDIVIWLFELDENGAPVPASAIELVLSRLSAGGGAGASPAFPPPQRSGPPATAADDPVLASGSHGVLTLDNAKAFIEALEFVLEQIGYPYELTEADRAQALEELKAGYPQAAPEDQALLAQSREVWQRVQANWDAAATEEREEFALGVLVLAFGEDTVRSWLRSGSAGGGLGASTDCATFEDCTSSFVDQETWSDTFNTQGCWAAAGCGGYDASTNTFTYDGY